MIRKDEDNTVFAIITIETSKEAIMFRVTAANPDIRASAATINHFNLM